MGKADDARGRLGKKQVEGANITHTTPSQLKRKRKRTCTNKGMPQQEAVAKYKLPKGEKLGKLSETRNI